MVRRVCDPDHVKLDRLEPRTINAPRPQRLVRLDSPFHQGKGQRPMQNPLGAAQTAQWSWILQTVWGWIWGLLRLAVGLLWRTLKNLVTSPFAMLDSSSRQPGVPWIAFMLLLFWSAIEATIFTFTLRPTMSELLSDLTGYQVNPLALVV